MGFLISGHTQRTVEVCRVVPEQISFFAHLIFPTPVSHGLLIFRSAHKFPDRMTIDDNVDILPVSCYFIERLSKVIFIPELHLYLHFEILCCLAILA